MATFGGFEKVTMSEQLNSPTGFPYTYQHVSRWQKIADFIGYTGTVITDVAPFEATA